MKIRRFVSNRYLRLTPQHYYLKQLAGQREGCSAKPACTSRIVADGRTIS